MRWRRRESETIFGKTSVGSGPTAYPGIKVSKIGKGNHRHEHSWQREVVQRLRNGMDNMALSDQGSTLFNTATKVAQQHPEEVQQFHTFRTTDEYVVKNIDSVIR